MKTRLPTTLRRIILELLVVILLQFALSHVLTHVRLLDHLLSPGSESNIALGVTTAFLLLRMFVMLFAPGWFIARLWLWWSRQKQING